MIAILLLRAQHTNIMHYYHMNLVYILTLYDYNNI